ncbi:hypothetical protein ACHAWF_013435 [Thalassiosira exigua]
MIIYERRTGRRNTLKARPPPMKRDDPYYPGNDRRYEDLTEDQIPLTESLMDCMERARPLWEYGIRKEIERGNTVLVVAHTNTLRGLMQVIDGEFVSRADVAPARGRRSAAPALRRPRRANEVTREAASCVSAIGWRGGRCRSGCRPGWGGWSCRLARRMRHRLLEMLPLGMVSGAGDLMVELDGIAEDDIQEFDADMNPLPPAKGKISQAHTSGIFLEKPGLLKEALQRREKWRNVVPGTSDATTHARNRVNTLEESLLKLKDETGAVANGVATVVDPNDDGQLILTNAANSGTTDSSEDDDDDGGSEFEAFARSVPEAEVTLNVQRADKVSPGIVKQGTSTDPVVVFVRHGRTPHNNLGLFTGWEDPPLAPDGVEDAKNAGRLLKMHGFDFDVVYTSWLTRAIETAWYCLEELDDTWLPMVKSWRLNERMYGALTGKSKQMIANEYGEGERSPTEEVAPRLQDPTAARLALLVQLSWKRLQTNEVREGPPCFPLRDHLPQHPGKEVAGPPKVSKDGEPVGLRECFANVCHGSARTVKLNLVLWNDVRADAKVHSVLHPKNRSRSSQQREARAHHESRKCDKRDSYAPLRNTGRSDEPAAPSKRPPSGEQNAGPRPEFNDLLCSCRSLPKNVSIFPRQVYNVKRKCITLLDDGSGKDPMEVHDFGPAAQYLFRPCELDDDFFEQMEQQALANQEAEGKSKEAVSV